MRGFLIHLFNDFWDNLVTLIRDYTNTLHYVQTPDFVCKRDFMCKASVKLIYIFELIPDICGK